MSAVNQSYCLFIISLLALSSTAITIKPTRIGWLTVPVFFIAWMTGELAWFHIIWQGTLLIYVLLSNSSHYALYGLSTLMLAGSLAGLCKLHIGAHKSREKIGRAHV